MPNAIVNTTPTIQLEKIAGSDTAQIVLTMRDMSAEGPRGLLEPDAGKLASPVLRGPGDVKASPGYPTSSPVLLAVDGNSLAHRAYHAYEKSGMTDSTGKAVWATYGFLALLAGICDKVQPHGIVVGFDDHTSSVRKDRCPEYKAQRSAKAPELYQQMEDLKEILAELGVQVVVPAGLEADDVIGSAAAAAEAVGWKCVIATSDRDSFSLINEETTVLRLVSGLDNAIWATPSYLVEKYGVRPDQYIYYAALRGDVSDNLPGAKGIGEKTAAKLLAGIEDLLPALEDETLLTQIVGKSSAAKLMSEEARTNIVRNLDIMTIQRTIPLDVEGCRLAVQQETVSRVLLAKELPNLVRRLTVTLCSGDSEYTDEAAPYLGGTSAPKAEAFNYTMDAPMGVARGTRAIAALEESLSPMGSDRVLPGVWPSVL